MKTALIHTKFLLALKEKDSSNTVQYLRELLRRDQIDLATAISSIKNISSAEFISSEILSTLLPEQFRILANKYPK